MDVPFEASLNSFIFKFTPRISENCFSNLTKEQAGNLVLKRKLASVKGKKADVSSVSRSSERYR